MKKVSPLWAGTAVLIELVILVLAFVRGAWLIPVLLAVFAGWSLWLILTQLLPIWRNNQAYRRKERELQAQTVPATGGGTEQAGQELAQILLQHVNYRILEILKAAYPKVRWEWAIQDPAALAAEGGTGRIRVYGVPDFEYVDVTLDRQAHLRCDLVKVVPVMAGAGSAAPGPGEQTLNPGVWYELRGRKVLESLRRDLQSRGDTSQTVKENGDVCVQNEEDGKDQVKDTLLDLPGKTYWHQLAEVMEKEGIAAAVTEQGILVSW